MKINYILFVVLFSLYSNLAYSNNPCAGIFDKVKKTTGTVVNEVKKSTQAMVGEANQAKETLQRGWGNVAKERIDNVTGGVKKSAQAMVRDAKQGTGGALEKVQQVTNVVSEKAQQGTSAAVEKVQKMRMKTSSEGIEAGKTFPETGAMFSSLEEVDSLNLEPRIVNIL